jgi:hypothetical protein
MKTGKQGTGFLFVAIVFLVGLLIITFAPKGTNCQKINDLPVVDTKLIGSVQPFIYNSLTRNVEPLRETYWRSDFELALDFNKYFNLSDDYEYRSDDEHQWWVCDVRGKLKTTLKKDN